MAAGDLALAMLITATDLASVVVADMATTYIDSTVAMTDSTVLLNDAIDLTTVALADGDEAILSTMSAADALAASADAAAVSLTTTADAADVTSVSLGRTSAIAKESSADLGLIGMAGETASFGLDKLKLGAEVVGVALVASIVLAGNFQERINKLYTSAGESKDNLKMVGDAILKMSVDTATSTKQLADGMYMVESAGFHGAAGLHVLQLAAEGAKAENASLETVANAVTSALNAYHYGADKAAFVTNTMVAAVGAGKMRMEDLAAAVANILPVSAKFGISLTDVTAGLSTMTSMGDDASSAATHLRQMILALEAPASAGEKALKSIGLTTQEVTDGMRKSVPDTIQMITDALGKKFPEGTYAYNEAIKNIAGGSKQLMGMLELSGQSLDTFKGNVDQISKAVKQGGENVLGWDVIQNNFNFIIMQAVNAIEALFIKVGTALLPVLSQLMQDINPLIQSFSDWIDKSHVLEGVSKTLTGWLGYIADGFHQVFDFVKPVTSAMKPFVDSFDRASAIIKPMAGLMKPLTDSFDRAKSVIKPVTAALNPMADSFDRATAIISKVHDAVGKQPNVWVPFWTEIKHVRDQIMGINWGAVWKGIQEIGTAISKMDWGKVGAFFSNVATNISKMDWGKFSKAFEGAILSLTKVDWGKVEEGFSQISGMLIGVDWNKIGSDLPKAIDALSKVDWGELAREIGQVSDGIKQMQQMFDWFGTWVGGGWLANVITGIIKWFQWLYDTLIGHSIIPDLINGMVRWFAGLPGKVIRFVINLVMNVVRWFQSLGPLAMIGINGFIMDAKNALARFAGQAVQLGSNIVQGIARGISGAFGYVGTQMSRLMGYIGSFLPHSPAKQGELSHLNEYGPSFVKGFADGITRSHPLMHTAMAGLTGVMSPSSSFALGGGSGSGNAFALSGGQTIVVQVQPAKQDIILNHRKVGEGVMTYAAHEVRVAGIRNR